MYDVLPVNGANFIKRVQEQGKQRGVEVRFVKMRGKGSHGRLYYGEQWTTVKDRKHEIGVGLLRAMAKQLGLDPRDIL